MTIAEAAASSAAAMVVIRWMTVAEVAVPADDVKFQTTNMFGRYGFLS